MDGPTLFQKLLDHHKLNPTSLAKKVGRATLQSGYQRFLEGGVQEPRRNSLQPAAEHFGVDVGAFYSPELADSEWARVAGLPPPIPGQGTMGGAVFEAAGSLRAPRPVVVVGQAKLGDNGYYEEISSATGAGDGTVAAYSSDPEAYALRVKGDSMFPAIRDGWYVVVEPNGNLVIGEFILVKLLTGQKMVKELLMQNEHGITVMSVNGSTRRTIGREEIDNHHGLQPVSSILPPSKWKPV